MGIEGLEIDLATAGIVVANLLVLAYVMILYRSGGAIAIDSVRAMVLRSGVWLVLLLMARGLLLAGVDVIGDCVTEINVTSPTCFQEIQQQTGFDVAAMFVDALENSFHEAENA